MNIVTRAFQQSEARKCGLEGCISGRVRQSGAHSGSYPCKTSKHFDITIILS